MQKFIATWLLLILPATLVTAQVVSPIGGKLSPKSSLGSFPGLDPNSLSPDDVSFSAKFELEQGQRSGRLSLQVQTPPKSHVYSLTQPDGGPLKSTIVPKSAGEYQLTGQFAAQSAPHVVKRPEFKVHSEEHEGTVVWSAPIALAEGVDPSTLEITGVYNGLVCADGGACVPLNKIQWKAKFAGYVVPAPKAESPSAGESGKQARLPGESTSGNGPTVRADYQVKNLHARVGGKLVSAKVPAGGTLEISLGADPDATYHIYANTLEYKKEIGAGEPTLIGIKQPLGWHVVDIRPSTAPTVIAASGGLPSRKQHESSVDWLVKVTIPKNTLPGEYDLLGSLGLQTCTETQCDPPDAVDFSAKVTVLPAEAEAEPNSARPLVFSPGNYVALTRQVNESQVARLQAGSSDSGDGPKAPVNQNPQAAISSPETPSVSETKSPAQLWSMLLFALLGGAILNVMPCVLPVVGLKIHSFIKQAGYSWGRNFLLNLSFSAGLITVFMVLGVLAVFAGLAWGQQFSSAGFNIGVTALIFAMALSLIGVWEIPIPGFGGSAGSAKQEGLGGAFVKGVVTTLLATPCSGPFLGAVLGWAVVQSPGIALLVFFFMGLGMASPYLLIGFAPRLVSFLPKPGEWMDTFKQIMGFVLMATVVYLLSVVGWTNVLPTIGFLVFLGASCWWIGRVPVYAEFSARLKAWGGAIALSTLGAYLMFGWLSGVMNDRFAAAVDQAIARRAEASNSDEAVLLDLQVQRSLKLREKPDELPELAFTPRRFELLRRAKHPVFIDFTADWCLSCQVNKAAALHRPKVREQVEKYGVYVLVADLSPNVPFLEEMNALLQGLGSKSIPFYAFYPPRDGAPEILRDVVSEAQVNAALEKANASPPSMAMRQSP